jgi:HEAT repeat protein
MPLPKSFKTDESFLEKIAIGATGTRRTFQDLRSQGHDPMELERGSMSFKIWKAIKVKRVRVPDILCLRCARRVESRAKTNMEISMSHSTSNPERGWDFGLEDSDMVALAHCEKTGPGPLDWVASPLVQYITVRSLREAWRANVVKMERPKGAQEGFEIRATWPSAVAKAAGTVDEVNSRTIRYLKASDNRSASVRIQRGEVALRPLVTRGAAVQPNQIIASVVSVSGLFPCEGGATEESYISWLNSTSLSDRYAGVKALSRFAGADSTEALLERVRDTREHIFVRVDAASGLMRRGNPAGKKFLAATLQDEYLENRLEAAIVLGEVATPEAAQLLITALGDQAQHPEIRAGAAWSLGELGAREALPSLVQSFSALDIPVKIEAARALAKLARKYVDAVIQALPHGTPEERPGIAWALSKADGFRISQLLPALVDEDARQWVAYIIGTQDREKMVPEIETLAARDPQVYFAVTVLWKIIASWVYDLEEY